MAKLKPCPFCGQTVRITEMTVNVQSVFQECKAKIECDCGLTFEREWMSERFPTGIIALQPDIETAWNTRTPQKEGGK